MNNVDSYFILFQQLTDLSHSGKGSKEEGQVTPSLTQGGCDKEAKDHHSQVE